MSKKEIKEAEVKEEVVAEAEAEVKEEKSEEKAEKVEEKAEKTEEKSEKVKAPKKTKAEINKEMKAAIKEENESRTDRNRAEKAARREAKAARKEAKVVEEKKKRIGNGLLALMIFGAIALMFLFVLGYNAAQKEANLESFIANNGGTDVYSNLQISDTQTLSITAEKNTLNVVFDCKSKKEAKVYKDEGGEDQLKYIGSYYLATMKPDVRGRVKAHIVVNLNGKEYTSVDVKWSEVDDILEENGMSLDDFKHDHEHVHED